MRLSSIWFSPSPTIFSVSLSLLQGLSEWKKGLLFFSLWMIPLDESKNEKCKDSLLRNFHTNEGRKWWPHPTLVQFR